MISQHNECKEASNKQKEEDTIAIAVMLSVIINHQSFSLCYDAFLVLRSCGILLPNLSLSAQKEFYAKKKGYTTNYLFFCCYGRRVEAQ